MDDQPETGELCTANRMNDFIGGRHQGGIRYSGNFPDLRRIEVIIGGGADAIYPDEMHGGTIRYIGEGQEGDQKLAYGNRALVWAYLQEMPIHVFVNGGRNFYHYRGPHHAASVPGTIVVNRKGADRGAFAFDLVKAEDRS
jgi:hypothetical protein